MFDKINELLREISDFPNLYVSENMEYVLEPISNSDAKDYYRRLKFSIVRRGRLYTQTVVYRANCKENNPDEYLKIIKDDLEIIKSNYLKNGWI